LDIVNQSSIERIQWPLELDVHVHVTVSSNVSSMVHHGTKTNPSPEKHSQGSEWCPRTRMLLMAKVVCHRKIVLCKH
jgi:hypothetical protein